MNKKQIIILGAGTAGTMVANHLAKHQSERYQITIIDQHEKHYYQPGFLLYPFGRYKEADIIRSRSKLLSKKVDYLQHQVEKIDTENNQIQLAGSVLKPLDYDLLIIATGSRIAPEETPGMQSEQWYKSIFDFYTFEGASALRQKLARFNEGTLVISITEMPIKCPVAPLEFAFLADSYFKQRGIRDKVVLKFVTPLDGAFTKPKASQSLGYLLKEKNIEIVPDFNLEHIDNENNQLVSYDERKVDYDLLVTVPTNKGDDLMERSNLGDELNFVPTNHHTLQSKSHQNIFVIGDATDVPASKAGSVAHFQVATLVENIKRYFAGQDLKEGFDGHANCFVETGGAKALLIDFNYEVEPLEGKFPWPIIGPLKLLKESWLNHFGKLAFRWIYWYLLLPGRPLPGIPNKMSLRGKKQ